MRSDLLRTYKLVHTWAGLIPALLLFVAFYAGALTIFEPALTRWAAPSPARPVTGLDRADALIAATLAAHPESGRSLHLHLETGGGIPARLTWPGRDGDAGGMGAALAEDGTVQTFALPKAPLGQVIDSLHRTGGLPVDVELGAAIMGIVCVLYLLALVSGLVIVLPGLLRDLFALRLDASLKRLWLDIHNLLGVLSLPFHVVIALTSVVFGLHDQIYGTLDRLVYEGRLRQVFMAENPFAAVPRDPAPAPMRPVAELRARIEATAPAFRPTALQYRDAGTRGAIVTVWGEDDSRMVRGHGFAVMSAVTGAIVNTEYLPGHQSGIAATIAAFFALHFASFGGPAVAWGYVVLGLGGAVLFYSGNLLWIETRRRRAVAGGDTAAAPSRASRWMAALTVGICLGCVIGISGCVAIARFLPGLGVDPKVGFQTMFYGSLLGAAVWSFIRGADRAGGNLLWLAAAVTVAIPLSTMLAWVGLVPLRIAENAGLGVETAALAGAAIFVALARAATSPSNATETAE